MINRDHTLLLPVNAKSPACRNPWASPKFRLSFRAEFFVRPEPIADTDRAAYPINDHKALLDTAKAELNRKARPALKADVPNFDSYDTIYIGYPIWWGDLPMCIYTFMESHQWNGKTVIPFCTHEGSSLAGTESSIRSTCKGATLLKGLAVRGSTAQNNRTAARKSVQDWLKQIGK